MANTSFSLDELQDMIAKEADGYRGPSRLLMSSAMEQELKKEAKSYMYSPDYNLTEVRALTHFMGLPVTVTDALPDAITYDWSGCRSPSRAKRRHARGIPQRVKITKQPVAWIMERNLLSPYERDVMRTLYGDFR